MKLELASAKAVRYACLNFHYAKAVPTVSLSFNVFNSKNEWCGVICYGKGANTNISKPYGLMQGEVIELLRMALNGKQESTTKAMSISLKLIKKYAPLVKLVVSYADYEQGHIGTIYQATNWYYTGYSTGTDVIVNGKRQHKKTIASKFNTNSIESLKSKGLDIKTQKSKPKWRYIYPIDKRMIEICKKLQKPYPKKENIAVTLNT
jgi:hypothetical protein